MKSYRRGEIDNKSHRFR